ncbi:MAG: PAS domain S-box protein [Gammaproteobacteria bacterium]|nr:PAS domain S-box protein [Gammaproteobacteria bacterium]
MKESDNQSFPIDTAGSQRLTKRQLDQRLDALLGMPVNEQDMGETQFLLHELQVHQIELEIQNQELREAQQRLEETRDRYADLYDFAPVGYLTLDTKGVIRNINLTAASMLQTERTRLEGLPFVTQLAAGEHRGFYQHLGKVIESRQRHVFELRLKQPNNLFSVVRLACLPVTGPLTGLDDEAGGCNCAIIDITGEIQAEQRLRTERDRVQLYLDTVENIIVALDKTGAISLINRKACELLGYAEAELIGKDWFTTCLPASEVDDFRQIFSQLIAGNTEQVTHVTNPVITRGGVRRHIVWHNKSLREGNGEITGVLSCGEDVTERQHLEQELSLLHKAVEQNPNSVIVTDLAGRIEYTNPAFTRKTGYDLSEVLGQSPGILKSGKTSGDQYKSLWQAISSGDDWAGEMLNKKKSGELFWELVSISPMRNSADEITHYLSIQEDVTEKKRLKSLALQHQAELAYMARLNTMGEMATGLAHELNQPLTAITTYADVAVRMLKAGITEPDKFREIVEESRKQALRASEIIRHLRQLVKKQGPEKAELDLNELIVGVLGFLETEIQKQGVTIQRHLQAGLPPLFADNIQIEQVLINLLHNAFEAEPPPSGVPREVTIRTAIIGNKLVQTVVSDNGQGMDKETLSRVFDPFFSTKGKRGMGMGLSICRSIIEAHDGRLWAISKPGEGSIFFFNLPIPAAHLASE